MQAQRGARIYVAVTAEGVPNFEPDDPQAQDAGPPPEQDEVSESDAEPEVEASSLPLELAAAQVDRLDDEAAGALRLAERADEQGDVRGVRRALEHGEAAADLSEGLQSRVVRQRTESGAQPQSEPSAPSRPASATSSVCSSMTT